MEESPQTLISSSQQGQAKPSWSTAGLTKKKLISLLILLVGIFTALGLLVSLVFVGSFKPKVQLTPQPENMSTPRTAETIKPKLSDYVRGYFTFLKDGGLWIADLNGQNQTEIVRKEDLRIYPNSSIKISKNGEEIVWIAEEKDEKRSLYSFNFQSGQISQLFQEDQPYSSGRMNKKVEIIEGKPHEVGIGLNYLKSLEDFDYLPNNDIVFIQDGVKILKRNNKEIVKILNNEFRERDLAPYEAPYIVTDFREVRAFPNGNRLLVFKGIGADEFVPEIVDITGESIDVIEEVKQNTGPLPGISPDGKYIYDASILYLSGPNFKIYNTETKKITDLTNLVSKAESLNGSMSSHFIAFSMSAGDITRNLKPFSINLVRPDGTDLKEIYKNDNPSIIIQVLGWSGTGNILYFGEDDCSTKNSSQISSLDINTLQKQTILSNLPCSYPLAAQIYSPLLIQ